MVCVKQHTCYCKPVIHTLHTNNRSCVFMRRYSTSERYRIHYEDNYEPYVVVSTAYIPPFDEKFRLCVMSLLLQSLLLLLLSLFKNHMLSFVFFMKLFCTVTMATTRSRSCTSYTFSDLNTGWFLITLLCTTHTSDPRGPINKQRMLQRQRNSCSSLNKSSY